MEQENRKVLRTKKLLRALCQLINRVSLPEITVAELCRQAHVSRASFYRHYTIPQDVLTAYFGDLFAKAVKAEPEIPEPAVIEQTLLQFCRAYYQHQQLFRSYIHLYNGFLICYYYIIDKIIRQLLKKRCAGKKKLIVRRINMSQSYSCPCSEYCFFAKGDERDRWKMETSHSVFPHRKRYHAL